MAVIITLHIENAIRRSHAPQDSAWGVVIA
jgi:hypothetical protein